MTVVSPPAPPLLGSLLGGFVVLMAGIAVLTVVPRRAPLISSQSTVRALGYILVYGLSAGCFTRVLQPALLSGERSPWLLALGDMIFITLSLFAWVMVLAEGHSLAVLGI